MIMIMITIINEPSPGNSTPFDRGSGTPSHRPGRVASGTKRDELKQLIYYAKFDKFRT